MANLKYYADEDARYPELRGKLTTKEAEIAIRKLARHFKVPMPRIRFTSGCRHSRANRYRVTLNVASPWRTLFHEFAHTMHDFKGRNGENWHGRSHRKLMARISRYGMKLGWHLGTLAHCVAVAEVETWKKEDEARKPVPADVRIEKKEKQAARLRTKIRGLTTRLKSCERSIGALKRAAAKRAAVEKTQDAEPVAALAEVMTNA